MRAASGYSLVPPPVPLVGFPIRHVRYRRWSLCGWIWSRPVPTCALSSFPHLLSAPPLPTPALTLSPWAWVASSVYRTTASSFSRTLVPALRCWSYSLGFHPIHHCNPLLPRRDWPPRELYSSFWMTSLLPIRKFRLGIRVLEGTEYGQGSMLCTPADALSRSANPSDLGFSSLQSFPVDWSSSSCSRPSTSFEIT